jgi:hypothetical protein
MGVPLRSNIFKRGTDEHQYFRRFPVQVVVLFSPGDRAFADAFRDLFTRLEGLTGDDVAFFAVLDPPDEWLRVAGDRQWWREYQARIGRVGFGYDDRVLVREIARLFGVRWHQLPALVVSTDLWTGEFLSCPTSACHVERQTGPPAGGCASLGATTSDPPRPGTGRRLGLCGDVPPTER